MFSELPDDQNAQNQSEVLRQENDQTQPAPKNTLEAQLVDYTKDFLFSQRL